MPKADATELAPKNRHKPLCFRNGFRGAFSLLHSLVKLRSRGLGQVNAKTARLLLPGAPFPVRSVSQLTFSIRNLDRLAQRWRWAIPKPLHPFALAARFIVFRSADLLGCRCRFLRGQALFNTHIFALESNGNRAVATRLHAYFGSTHSWTDFFPHDLMNFRFLRLHCLTERVKQ